MDLKQSHEFRRMLTTLSSDQLYSRKIWNEKKGDKGQQELFLIESEIRRREKIKRYYESYIY